MILKSWFCVLGSTVHNASDQAPPSILGTSYDKYIVIMPYLNV